MVKAAALPSTPSRRRNSLRGMGESDGDIGIFNHRSTQKDTEKSRYFFLRDRQDEKDKFSFFLYFPDFICGLFLFVFSRVHPWLDFLWVHLTRLPFVANIRGWFLSNPSSVLIRSIWGSFLSGSSVVRIDWTQALGLSTQRLRSRGEGLTVSVPVGG